MQNSTCLIQTEITFCACFVHWSWYINRKWSTWDVPLFEVSLSFISKKLKGNMVKEVRKVINLYHYRIYSKSGFPFCRQAWALVSVVGGGNSSCTEHVREHENHDTGGKALARQEFVTVDGVRFFVSAYSEWWNGKLPKHLKSQHTPSPSQSLHGPLKNH